LNDFDPLAAFGAFVFIDRHTALIPHFSGGFTLY
jgi:hypothetical protein